MATASEAPRLAVPGHAMTFTSLPAVSLLWPLKGGLRPELAVPHCGKPQTKQGKAGRPQETMVCPTGILAALSDKAGTPTAPTPCGTRGPDTYWLPPHW